MIRCITVDDEPLALEIMEAYIAQVKDLTLIAQFTDAIDAFRYIENNPVDILFLDLNMPLLSGMELLRNLKRRPAIIITTAYRDFAVESFELDVSDYLVKPIAFPRFLKAVNKTLLPPPKSRVEATVPDQKTLTEDPLWLKVDKKMVSLLPRDILYIQSLKDYVRVVTADQKMVIYHTLQALLDKLPAHDFLRIHKSYVVQVSKIKFIEGNRAHLLNETLPIGRNYRKNLLTRL